MNDPRKELTDRLIHVGYEPEMATRMVLAAKEVQDEIHNFRLRGLQAIADAFPAAKPHLTISGIVLELEVEDTARLFEAFKEIVTS